jgi:ABC-type lipoprotein export system ATPase subunit
MKPSEAEEVTLLNIVGLLDSASTEFIGAQSRNGGAEEERKIESKKRKCGFIFRISMNISL